MTDIVKSMEENDWTNFDAVEFVKGLPLSKIDNLYDAFPISALADTRADTRCERAVLEHIIFWYPKARTARHGYIWLIRPADEFQKYGVDYKADTIRRAVRALVKKEILVSERHFHPYRPIPGPVLWLRPGVPMFDDTKGKHKKKVAPHVPACS